MASDPLINRVFGHFFVQERLGTGGVAAVYKALDQRSEQTVALKVLHAVFDPGSDMAQRFAREAEITAHLQHPQIVRVHEYGILADRPYLMMEFMKGGSLAARFDQPARISTAATAKLLRQVASALDYAHQQGIVHRDMKLENILLGERGAALSDFGIARVMGGSRFTVTGNIIGTPLYMSPEQARGRGAIDHRADVYSLGIVAYLLLVGCFPFNGDDVLSILAQHLNTPAPPPSALNKELTSAIDAVLLKALSKNPDERYPTAGEFAAALSGAIASAPALQVLVDTRHIHTLTPPSQPETVNLDQMISQEDKFSADEWYHRALEAASDEEKIAYLRRALEIAPLHSAANRALFKLEGAKPRQASIPAPLLSEAPPLEALAALPIERRVRKDAQQRRAERQRQWTQMGCVFSLLLSVSCSLLTLRLIGLGSQLTVGFKTLTGGPTPVQQIGGTPVRAVQDAPMVVTPEKITELTGDESQAVDVLDPGYVHAYQFKGQRGTEVAVYIQFMSLTAHNVSPNVAIIDPDGQPADNRCYRDNAAVLVDNSGVMITCQIDKGGTWSVNIFGREGESNGAYFVGVTVLDG